MVRGEGRVVGYSRVPRGEEAVRISCKPLFSVEIFLIILLDYQAHHGRLEKQGEMGPYLLLWSM